MFEDLILRMEVTEQSEPNHTFVQKVHTYTIDKPSTMKEILSSVEDIVNGDLDTRDWPNNLWECDRKTERQLERAGVTLPPYIGVIRIDISYGRRGFNHE